MTVQRTESYGSFSLALHSKARRDRLPVNASIEISHRCPLRCSQCYNNLPMTDAEAASKELSSDEYRRILDEMADLGCLWLLFTGGEIFARHDFLDIYTYAKKKGFIITLFTNGTMITPRVADYLVEWPPFSVEITLYGWTAETYERVTGVRGSHAACMRGIQLLRERDLPVNVKTMVLTVNRHEVWEIKRFVEDELGRTFKLDAMINPRTDCSASPLDVRLTPAEVVEIDLMYTKRAEEWRAFAERSRVLPTVVDGETSVYSCGGGVQSFSIDPRGRMTVCVLSQRESFDLRKGTLRDGWEHLHHSVRERKTRRVTKCTTCQVRSICGMCPANGELASGDAEAPVDFLCHTAHLRAAVLGFPVPRHGECEFCEAGSEYPTLAREATELREKCLEGGVLVPSSPPSGGGPSPVLIHRAVECPEF